MKERNGNGRNVRGRWSSRRSTRWKGFSQLVKKRLNEFGRMNNPWMCLIDFRLLLWLLFQKWSKSKNERQEARWLREWRITLVWNRFAQPLHAQTGTLNNIWKNKGMESVFFSGLVFWIDAICAPDPTKLEKNPFSILTVKFKYAALDASNESNLTKNISNLY